MALLASPCRQIGTLVFRVHAARFVGSLPMCLGSEQNLNLSLLFACVASMLVLPGDLSGGLRPSSLALLAYWFLTLVFRVYASYYVGRLSKSLKQGASRYFLGFCWCSVYAGLAILC